MTKRIERYRQQAEERYSQFDAVLAAMDEQSDSGDGAQEGAASKKTQRPRTEPDPDRGGCGTRHPHVREFEAPPERVFRAFVDPDLAQWRRRDFACKGEGIVWSSRVGRSRLGYLQSARLGN